MADEAENTADNFEDAFSRLASLEDETKLDEVAATPLKKDDEEPSEVGKEVTAPESAPEAAAEPANEPVEKVDESAADEKAPQVDATEAILEKLARLVKETPDSQPEPQVRQPVAQPEPELFSQEEKELLTSYEKDWPEVARAEALRRKAEYRDLVTYVFNEVAKELRPIVETVHTISQRTHLSDLKSTVNDYDDVRDKVIDWVQQQPTYLQIAYKHVIENGTVDEVADLVNRYKRDTGVQAASAASAPVARKVETELPTATKQAAASLAPVSSKRTAVLQASDPDDFESAFASFASKL